MVRAYLVLALVAFVRESLALDDGCLCSAECHAIGDPHIEDFAGEEKKITAATSLFYKEGDFEITIDTATYQEIKSFTFGSKTYNVDTDCKENNYLYKLEEQFSDKSSVSLHAYCKKLAKHHKSPWRFDLYLYKNDFSKDEEDFAAMERSEGASGLCVNLNGLTPTGHGGYQPVCECQRQAVCSLVGDPHLTDFWGEKQKIWSKNYVIYKEGSFEISGVTGEHYDEMIQLTFGSEQFDVSKDCKYHNQKFYPTHKFENGDIVEARVECKYLEKHHLSHWRFDVQVTKTDRTKNLAETMRSAEQAAGSSGLCVSLPN